MDAIVAQIGEDKEDRVTQWAECDGHRVTVMARGDAVLKLARVLIAAGYEGSRPYETRRGERTAMRYRTLAHAAKLTVNETASGPRFAPYKPYVHGREAE